ncbi:MAG: AAA family ATPase, partial [Elusimicrobiota bacterium]|nr:AAA family ATPase [Elusimicrobiota bacterium]
MKKQDIFKTNQEYLAEFFNISGAQKRNSWEPPEPPERAVKKSAAKPVKVTPKEEVIKYFQTKVKQTLRAGVNLPLEGLGKKHKLCFTEKAILAYFAGTALYRARMELGSMIGRFESKGISPAFETVKLISPGSTLIKKKLIITAPCEFPSRYSEETALPGGIFSLITGIALSKVAKPRRKARVISAGSPAKIYETLGEYVVGQQEAKKTVSAGVFLHLKRSELNKKRSGPDKIAKSNILIIGPTGSGKTHICRTLSSALNIPFHISDATQYTETGYVGKCVEEMLLDLHKDKDLSPSAQAIIYIDE